MAPIVSLAVRRLPPTLTAIDLRDYLVGNFPAPTYLFHVWPLVNEFNGSAGISSTKCATIAVRVKVPALQKLDKMIDNLCDSLSAVPFHYDGKQWRIFVDKYFHSVVPLYEHQEGASIDIFTIHGLGGHAFHTWCNDPHDKPHLVTNWARDLLPTDLEQAGIASRISSVGYNADFLHKADPTANIRSLAEGLLEELVSQRADRSRPFFFICHSLGGLVLCQALILCLYHDHSYDIEKPRYREVFMRGNVCMLKGIHFLGTPFSGSLRANTAKPFVEALKAISPYSVNVDLIQALTSGEPDLADIVNKFHHIHVESNISLWIGCESRPILGDLVTTRDSAIARFGRTATIATMHNATHTSMVRYDSSSPNFIKIATGLVQMVRNQLDEQDMPGDGSGAIGAAAASRTSGIGQTTSTDTSLKQIRRADTAPLDNRGSSAVLQSRQSSNLDGSISSQTAVSQNIAHRSRDSVAVLNGAHTSQPSHGHASSRDDPLIAAPALNVADGSKLAKLAQYDTVFVIDDTNSMILPANRPESEASISRGQKYTDRWSVLEVCLKNVVNTVTGSDRDGVDVRFLKCGKDSFRENKTFDADHLKNGQDLLDRLKAIRTKLGTPKCQGGTAFFDILYTLLSERCDKWKCWRRLRDALKPATLPKMLNVIVVTDGAADDGAQMEWAISEIAQELDACKAPPRCIGVQFVQIGDDAGASKWLRHLDDDLGRDDEVRFRDMIDTKPWNPNGIEQMLLGAVVKDIDAETSVT